MMLKLLILVFPLSVFAGNTRTIDADEIRSSDASKTYTLPSASTTLVGTDSTNTLTNKTISGSSNTITDIPANTALSSQVPISNGGTNSSSYNSGGVLFFNGTSLVDDYANLFWDNTNKRIGIGTNAPSFRLHSKSSSAPSIAVERVDSSATSGGYVLRKARGTIGAESALSLNDSIGSVSFFGYGATTYSATPSALISASSQEAFTDTAKGTRLVLSTTPNGSVSLVSSVAIQDSTVAIGRGFSSATPTSITIKGTDVSSGTSNTASGSVAIQSGLSTGNQGGGSIYFQSSSAGSSGSSQNSSIIRMSIDNDGYIRQKSPDGTKLIGFKVNDATTDHYYDWPQSQGASNTFLKNDGSGTLSWETLAPTYEQERPSGSIDGSNTGFTLTYTPATNSSLQVYIDGILQEQGVGKDYTVSGTTITFATAPSLGQVVIAIYTR